MNMTTLLRLVLSSIGGIANAVDEIIHHLSGKGLPTAKVRAIKDTVRDLRKQVDELLLELIEKGK